MKILMVHNSYLVPGGEDECFFQECRLLQTHGHDVMTYVRDNKIIEKTPLWKIALQTLWSIEDYQKIRNILRKEKPNLIHVQNTFPLISPSIFYAAHHEGIPTVLSLQNYRLYCLNAYFFRDGQICENCINQSIPWSGIRHRCYRKSLLGSIVLASLIALHRLLRTYQREVDAFITVTEFAKQKFANHGIPDQKIHVRANFITSPPTFSKDRESFFLYIGRLSPEKGIEVLLNAWKQLDHRIELKIAGSGPLEKQVQEAAMQQSNIEYLGQQPIQEIYRLLSRAQALIFPSLWYEGMPRTIVEAFAQGTPVIASKLGAMATMIEDQVTGLHVEPGNAVSLTNAILWLIDHPHDLDTMRQAVQKDFQTKYTAMQNYDRLLEIYDAAYKTFHHRSSKIVSRGI
jgi:glycosyltransferase involved in cell wall biosynthesis